MTSTKTSKQVATYKGRKYRCLYIGQTKYGRRAKLAFFSGGKEFWVDASQVSVQRDNDPLRDAYRYGWDGRIGSASYYSSGAFDELDM